MVDPGSLGNRVVVLEADEPRIPSEEEVNEYAAFLGIDPETEPHLMRIAREGVVAPVPHPWKACHNLDSQHEDEIFYFNFETAESVWDHPCDEKYRNMVEDAREEHEARMNASGGALSNSGRSDPDPLRAPAAGDGGASLATAASLLRAARAGPATGAIDSLLAGGGVPGLESLGRLQHARDDDDDDDDGSERGGIGVGGMRHQVMHRGAASDDSDDDGAQAAAEHEEARRQAKAKAAAAASPGSPALGKDKVEEVEEDYDDDYDSASSASGKEKSPEKGASKAAAAGTGAAIGLAAVKAEAETAAAAQAAQASGDESIPEEDDALAQSNTSMLSDRPAGSPGSRLPPLGGGADGGAGGGGLQRLGGADSAGGGGATAASLSSKAEDHHEAARSPASSVTSGSPPNRKSRLRQMVQQASNSSEDDVDADLNKHRDAQAGGAAVFEENKSKKDSAVKLEPVTATTTTATKASKEASQDEKGVLADLDSLARSLGMLKEIRLKQQEYLRLLKAGV